MSEKVCKQNFKELFEKYGFEVEQWSEDSYIADNGVYCIPYTEHDRYGSPEIWAITVDSCNRAQLKEMFKTETQIGCAAWCQGVPFPVYHDLIHNHDNMYFEVENTLKRIKK